MSWEDVDASFDHTRPEDILIHLDLSRFGELVGRIASETHRLNDLEQFDPHSPEAAHLAVDAWRYVCHMADRAEFVRKAQEDLDNLDDLLAHEPDPEAAPFNTQNCDTQGSVTPFGVGHLPEFGGAAPLPHASEELERRLEPPV